MVANMRGDIPLTVSIGDRPCEAHATYSWAAGGRVLTLSTVLPGRGLAAELISTYTGAADTPTIAIHLMLGPIGRAATIGTEEHAHEHLDPVESPRECVYDHAHQLIERLSASQPDVRVQLEEQSFTELERGE
jgi:hypothetical protein